MPISCYKLGFHISATLLLLASSTVAAPAPKLSGTIAGIVRDPSGVPQMGATVSLFNNADKLLAQAITNDRGMFGFDALMPEIYSIRVSLRSFIPAVRNKIAVQPGMQSLLYINMATVLSSIELVYAAPGQGALMSDDWKWTLKAADSIRPILRALPEYSETDPNRRQAAAGFPLFGDTRGIVTLSGGDPGSLGSGAQTDLGTAFAVSTSLLGRNQLDFSGGVGYTARSGVPAAAFRTSYRRDDSGPELIATLRQLYLPMNGNYSAVPGQLEGSLALRTVSLTNLDHLQFGDKITLEYGASLDTISFLDHLNYFSPFGLLTYDLGGWGSFRAGFSAGAIPADLITHKEKSASDDAAEDEAILSRDLAALALIPGISLRDGHTQAQRTQNLEIGYEKRAGGTRIEVTAFHEGVSNGILTASGGEGLIGAQLLPDISAKSSILNIGSYQRYGYAASLNRKVNDQIELGVSLGRAGALTTSDSELASSADQIRSELRMSQRFWVSARASATLPAMGTQISGSYQWSDSDVLLPTHYYLTGPGYPDPGLNLHVRQPIPSIIGIPGRLEATADLQNLLAQGYLPLPNRCLLLMQTPRAVRGGLSFIF